MAGTLLVLICSALADQAEDAGGRISGVVVQAAAGASVARAPVVLRAQIDGQWAPVAETTADAAGRFVFQDLPVDEAPWYWPGANRDGVHYPGPRVCLSRLERQVEVTLVVHEATTFPNPLVVRSHEITLCPEPGSLRVSESLVIENPGPTCYVGQPTAPGGEPVTVQLSIPANFEQTTFETEFFGRRFSLRQGKLVTGIPWPPGQRQLNFTYVLPRSPTWQRPLDLPTSGLRVSVQGDRPDQVNCNLGGAPLGEKGQLVFQADGRTLSAGHVVRVELGRLPTPVMAYAPWLALLVLLLSMAATGLAWVRQRRSATAACVRRSAGAPAVPSRPHEAIGRKKAGAKSRAGR